MSLNWNWNEKCGEATLMQKKADGTEKEYTLNLYQGNAFLIMLSEWTEKDGTDKYELFSFFLDEAHAKNCFGLNKREHYTKNIFCNEFDRITKVRLNRSKYAYTDKLVSMLFKAFDAITVEVYKED